MSPKRILADYWCWIRLVIHETLPNPFCVDIRVSELHGFFLIRESWKYFICMCTTLNDSGCLYLYNNVCRIRWIKDTPTTVGFAMEFFQTPSTMIFQHRSYGVVLDRQSWKYFKESCMCATLFDGDCLYLYSHQCTIGWIKDTFFFIVSSIYKEIGYISMIPFYHSSLIWYRYSFFCLYTVHLSYHQFYDKERSSWHDSLNWYHTLQNLHLYVSCNLILCM